MKVLEELKDAFLAHLEIEFKDDLEPQNLYAPIQYIVTLGGKRLRPVFTLLSCTLFKQPHTKALDAAMAVELFHNFSLIHDDIMDNAPLRRGKETVHEKWNLNTGILSGDAMLILAYQYFENYDPNTFQALAKLFSKTAIEVCEGQQYDMDFEQRAQVSANEYLNMINNKTAVLLGAAMQMGAIVAGASVASQTALYEYGRYLGIAFQMQDDYLDVYGDASTFGKQVGGDIIANKKTYLYLTALEYLDSENAHRLRELFASQPENASKKIEEVKHYFTLAKAPEKTKEAIETYTQKALSFIDKVEIDSNEKQILKDLATLLIHRTV